MIFNSHEFAAFFAVVLPLYWILGHRAQNALLLTASYAFYACWDYRFLSLLMLSTAMDYVCGLALDRIERPAARKACLAVSMLLNLGLLGFFKYANFFADSLQALLARAGLDVSLGSIEVALPIGISFYTFQSMSYVIDVYRREIKATRNLVQFAAFVSFFPHLVAGPIMRASSLLGQIRYRRRFSLEQFYDGVYLIAWGLTKKVAIADNLAPIVNDLFGRWDTIHGGQALIAVYAFAFQIYCDFSGYTDAARGIAKCLGIELALNFNLPYFARNPRDFWSRWHISLSTWLRDYLYIPLGGSRGGRLLTARNLMLTMLLGGLWHGAAWTFVAWGAYHGLWLVAHRRLEPLLARLSPRDAVHLACWRGVCVFVTFHLVCVGWLLFRAQSLAQAFTMLRAIFARPAIPSASLLATFAACTIPLLLVQLAQHAGRDLEIVRRTPWYARSLIYTAMFYAFVVAGEFGGGQFIYFQF